MLEFKSKKRILLIEPPFYGLFGYERWHYPITLTLVGTYLEELGHDVMIYDADKPSADFKSLNRTEVADNYYLYEKAIKDNEHPVWSEVKKTLEDFKPDIVGLTSISAKIDSTNMVAQIARELYGNKIKIILGGAHVEGMHIMFPDYDFGPNYDYIVPHIPNLVNRKPNKNLIMNLEEYSPANLSCLLTSTGCPNVCTFCCNSYNRTLVYRNISSIREEVEEIKESFSGKESVYILDDCLFSNTKHFKAVTQIIKGTGLQFTAGSRIMALSPQKIEDFIDCGGQRIYIGVESGSQRILDLIRKRLKVEETMKRAKWLNDFGIPWSAFFILGFPFETLDDLKLTEELIYAIQPTFVSLSRFTPYPGTQIYKEYFINEPIEFKDLFQLNRRSCVKLTDGIKDYIAYMFKVFDEYNRNSQNERLKR